MSYYKIRGGKSLNGTIRPQGNKNSALPLIAAALLTDQPVTLHNVPDIGDVRTKLALVESLGAMVEFEGSTCVIDASHICQQDPNPALSAKIRTSLLLAAPLLARFGQTRVFRPGGDRIGQRNLDTHLSALQAFGASIEAESDSYVLTSKGLTATDLFLEEMSVTGTCLLYTSPSPRDRTRSRMPSSA